MSGSLDTKQFVFLSIVFLAAWSLFSGCSKSKFPQYSSLDRLRILAIVVDSPEIQNPAAGLHNIQLTPIISDIGGSGDVQLEIQSCLDPGVNYGAMPDCTAAQQASSVINQVVSAIGAPTAGVFIDPERTGAPQSGAITVPLSIPNGLLGQYGPTLQYNGVSYLITVKATASGQTVRSFRRVLISTKTPNANPTIGDLLSEGISLAQRPGSGNYKLTFSTSDTPETFQFLAGNGSYKILQESYEVTWFVSDGTIESPRAKQTESVEWKVGAIDPGLSRKTVVVGVLRDGRGGLAVMIKTLSP